MKNKTNKKTASARKPKFPCRIKGCDGSQLLQRNARVIGGRKCNKCGDFENDHARSPRIQGIRFPGEEKIFK